MDENKTPENVPYIVHEGAMARLERSNRRLLIALIATFIVMLLIMLPGLFAITLEARVQNRSI